MTCIAKLGKDSKPGVFNGNRLRAQAYGTRRSSGNVWRQKKPKKMESHMQNNRSAGMHHRIGRFQRFTSARVRSIRLFTVVFW